jgi:hypothetical protein
VKRFLIQYLYRVLFLFCLSSTLIKSETLDIYLVWKYPQEASFNIYRRYDGQQWEKIGSSNTNQFQIKGVEKVNQEFTIKAIVNGKESGASQAIHLLSNKPRTPSSPKILLTNPVNSGIVIPTHLKLYGIIRP